MDINYVIKKGSRTMKKYKNLLIFLLIAVLALSLAGCGGTKDTSNTQNSKYKYGKLKIQALDGSVCGAPSYVAYQKGFFAKEGLDAELVSGTTDAMKTGLQTGEFVITNGDFAWFASIQNGVDLKVIGGLHHGCIKIVVPPDSTIKSAQDLKGKTIGVDAIGGTPMAVASVVVANAGFDPQKDVKWLAYPQDQLLQAIKKGEIDVISYWDPFGKLAQ